MCSIRGRIVIKLDLKTHYFDIIDLKRSKWKLQRVLKQADLVDRPINISKYIHV